MRGIHSVRPTLRSSREIHVISSQAFSGSSLSNNRSAVSPERKTKLFTRWLMVVFGLHPKVVTPSTRTVCDPYCESVTKCLVDASGSPMIPATVDVHAAGCARSLCRRSWPSTTSKVAAAMTRLINAVQSIPAVARASSMPEVYSTNKMPGALTPGQTDN